MGNSVNKPSNRGAKHSFVSRPANRILFAVDRSDQTILSYFILLH
jgi:hypothetical protein